MRRRYPGVNAYQESNQANADCARHPRAVTHVYFG